MGYSIEFQIGLIAIILLTILFVVYWIIKPKKTIEKYQSGEKRRKYFEKNNVRVGKEIVYYKNGKVNTEKYYSKGKQIGSELTYYPSGAIYIQTQYVDGILKGDYKIFEENGSIKEIKHY